MLNISEQESNPKIKQWVKDNFSQLFVRIGKSKNHVMRTQFSKDINPIQQKGRSVTVHLQERVEKELNKLIDQKHIIKSDKCSDRQFISPIVITVKKRTDGQIGIRQKMINKFFHKKKYQMANIDLLLDTKLKC